MRDIWTVAKKELRSCFGDRMILAMMILVPFAIVFGYSLLMSATAFTETDTPDDESKSVTAYSIHAPEMLSDMLTELGITEKNPEEADSIREQIAEEECALLVQFDADFAIAQPGTPVEALPGIEIWYNSADNDSYNLYMELNAVLSSLQPTVFLVNADADTTYNLVDESDSMRELLGIVMPMMLLMAVFMVCQNLAAESIAGDKERGFLNTMLLVPVNRSAIALGKSFSIFICAAIGGLSAFVGMALGLPRLTEAMGFEGEITYSFAEYAMLFLVTITAVFALASVLLLVSTLSKTVKQATTIAPIFLFIIMIGSMLTMSEPTKSMIEDLGIINYCIPAWNASMMLQDLIEMQHSMSNLLLCCVVNLVFSGIALFAVGRCFESERIING